MEHRVETLRIAVHTPAGREVPAARLAERFTREVVERFGEMVEARFPGRVVLIRQLALRWSLSEVEMADPAEATSRAADLADAVAAQGDGSLHASDTIAMFADEAAWLTAYLRERAADAGEGWFHAAWRDVERRGSAGASPLRREIVLMALSRLNTTAEFAAVLGALPRQTITALGAALGIVGADDGSVDSPKLVWPEAERGLPRPNELADATAALVAAGAIAALRTGEGQLMPAVPASPGLAESDGQTGHTTRFGGLFYLLSLVMELGIGESLWKACLPEGLVLAHAMIALLGPDAARDPAPAMFGGVTAGELREWPAVSPEQQAEACTELLAASAAALPRYGMAPGPEVLLNLVASPTGRLLVASGHSPFVRFSWPAADARAAAAGLAAFLGAWPAAFPPPRASRVLLGLDQSTRLRPSSGPAAAAPWVPAAPTQAVSALLAQICGATAELFVLRAGGAPAAAAELASRYLAIPGRVMLAPEAMTVVLPMASIDLGVRRAALDRDTGWVPWLQRTVRIEFAPEGREL